MGRSVGWAMAGYVLCAIGLPVLWAIGVTLVTAILPALD